MSRRRRQRAIDVFLSSPASGAELVTELTKAFQKHGLTVFSASQADPPSRITENVRDAIAEAVAVVVVMNRDALGSASMMFELGAAFGWNKAVFPILDGVQVEELPALLREHRSFSRSSMNELARVIAESSKPLNDEDESALAQLYMSSPHSIDDMLRRPALADDFVSRFNSRTRKKVSGEQLLSELLRLRKLGRLRRRK